MYDLEYIRAQSVEDAAARLADGGDRKVVAGGMSLLPSLKLRLTRVESLVDLGRIDALRGIALDDGALTIGAMTRHAAVAASDVVRGAIPALSVLAGGIGDPLVRNRGTMGGSIANADPAADYPSAVLGLGATVVTDRREIAGDAFFTGLFETALEPGEIVTRVRFPVPQIAGYAKYPNPASRFAVVGVFVARGRDGVRVAVTGAAEHVFRVAEAEQRLSREFSPAALDGLEVDPAILSSDIHASAEYRAHAVGVMARRAVASALQGAN